jgi:hypothetical protein
MYVVRSESFKIFNELEREVVGELQSKISTVGWSVDPGLVKLKSDMRVGQGNCESFIRTSILVPLISGCVILRCRPPEGS